MKKHVIAFALATTTALAALTGTAACTHAQWVAWSGDFATCAKADFGQLVAPGLNLLQDVGKIIDGNGVNLESDLTALAVIVGPDAVKCAITALVESRMPAAGSGSGSGSGSAATSALPPGMLRAEAWAAKH